MTDTPTPPAMTPAQAAYEAAANTLLSRPWMSDNDKARVRTLLNAATAAHRPTVSGDVVERVAALIRCHHRTHVRQPSRSNEPRRTFHQGDKVAAEEILAALHPVDAGSATAGAVPYTGAPPPHWDASAGGTHPSSNGKVRYPATAAEWDYRNDPGGDRGKELAERRLRFSYVLADPRAPDQMALVHRKDLGLLFSDLIRFRAYFEMKREPKPVNPAATAVPEGWKLVPVEPTEAMLDAGVDNLFGSSQDDWQEDARLIWSAMLAAAPVTPAAIADREVERIADARLAKAIAILTAWRSAPLVLAIAGPVMTTPIGEAFDIALTALRQPSVQPVTPDAVGDE